MKHDLLAAEDAWVVTLEVRKFYNYAGPLFCYWDASLSHGQLESSS